MSLQLDPRMAGRASFNIDIGGMMFANMLYEHAAVFETDS
jgi:hypothetical protein